MQDEIMVSINCNTYNHEPYIRQCLDGFVMQKTNFKYEVLVHDDASTDGTADIIREYEEKYPDIIKPIYQVENQYSKGVKISYAYQYPRAKGKYIAFCEGDDYWTDPLKLQKQYEAMEAHPEIDMCAHTVQVINSSDSAKTYAVAPEKEDTVIPVERVIAGGGAFVMTNSLFFRKSILDNTPRFRNFLVIDYTMQIHGSLRGGMLYLKDNMSVYRSLVSGGWTVRFQSNRAVREKYYRDRQTMLRILDEDTNMKYHDVIENKILTNEFQQYLEENNCKELFNPKFKSIMDRYPAKSKIKLRIKAYFPWLLKIKKRFVRGGFRT